MANPILWADATDKVFRAGLSDENDPPATFAESLEFDLATNAALWTDVNNTFDQADWRLSGGVLTKDGVTQIVQPWAMGNADRRDFSNGLQQALTDLQTISTATFANNAQRDNAIRRLAQIMRVLLRRVVLSLN